MKDDETTQGFSFQLSESPPPARAAAAGAGRLTDGNEDDWLAPPELAVEAARENRQRPGASTRASSVAADVATRTPPPATVAGGPAVKRIAFPRSAPTLFSRSVSQKPPQALAREDADRFHLVPRNQPVPAEPSASAELARLVWVTARRWALRGGRRAGIAATRSGRWVLEAGRSASSRALAAWRQRAADAATRPEAAGNDDFAPPVESASSVGSGWTERLRPALSASVALAAAGACYLAVGLVLPESTTSSEEPTAEAAAPPAIPTALPAKPETSPAPSSGTPAPPREKATTEQLPLPEGLSWPGKGLIEVVTGGRELIYVDGVFTGRGPLRRIPIAPGQHEVVLRTEASESKHAVAVSAERRTRLVLARPDDESPR